MGGGPAFRTSWGYGKQAQGPEGVITQASANPLRGPVGPPPKPRRRGPRRESLRGSLPGLSPPRPTPPQYIGAVHAAITRGGVAPNPYFTRRSGRAAASSPKSARPSGTFIRRLVLLAKHGGNPSAQGFRSQGARRVGGLEAARNGVCPPARSILISLALPPAVLPYPCGRRRGAVRSALLLEVLCGSGFVGSGW